MMIAGPSAAPASASPADHRGHVGAEQPGGGGSGGRRHGGDAEDQDEDAGRNQAEFTFSTQPIFGPLCTTFFLLY